MLIVKKIHSTAVLNILQQLTEKFVKKVCVSKGMPEHIVNKSGGKIFTFGSFRLGVYGPGQLLSPNHPCLEFAVTIAPHRPFLLMSLSMSYRIRY